MLKKLLASLSSIIAALLASSCCWLPFVLIGFGVSGGAIAAKISAFRPLFLIIAIAALGYSVFLYIKKRKAPACCEGETKSKFDWHLLSLISTTLIVLAIATYPLYYPLLLCDSSQTKTCNSTSITGKLDSLENNTAEKSSCCP